jgi:hypothetical protein
MLKRLFRQLVNFFNMTKFILLIFGIGKRVLVVNGAYRGQEATLEDIHQDTFSVDVTLLTVRLVFCFGESKYYVLGFNDWHSTRKYGL